MSEQAPRVWWRTSTAILAGVLLGGGVVAALARLFSIEVGPLAVVVAFTPWFGLLAAATVLLAAGIGAWRIAAGAAVLLALHAVWLAPLFVGGASGELELTVMTLNASYGDADPDQIVELVENSTVDILTIQELTPDLVAALKEAGVDRAFPFSVTQPETNHAGIGLWSRTEISNPAVLDELSSWAISGDIKTSHGEVTVFAVHPLPPGLTGNQRWSEDMAALTQLLDAASGPVLVAGDFNTTRDHAAFRHLERLGFVDESDQAAAGILLTFPQGMTMPPLFAIDHVLIRDAGWVAVQVDTIAVTGTDHRALVVGYASQ